MKKLGFYVVMAACLLSLEACEKSYDAEIFRIPGVAGQDLIEDEFQLVYSPTPGNCSLQLKVESGAPVYINWGEADGLVQYGQGEEITCEYNDFTKDYIVTIRSAGITKIDLTHKSFQRLKAAYFGYMPRLDAIAYRTDENILEAFDMSRNVSNGYFLFNVYTESFDLTGLKNFRGLSIAFYGYPHDIDLSNLKYKDLRLFLKSGSKVSVKNMPDMESLEIIGIPDDLGYAIFYDIEWDALPSLEQLKISYSYFHAPLDISNIPVTELRLRDFDCFDRGENIKFNDELELFLYTNNGLKSTYIKNIDLRDRDNLRVIQVTNNPGLESIQYRITDIVESILIRGCANIDDFEYKREGATAIKRKTDIIGSDDNTGNGKTIYYF